MNYEVMTEVPLQLWDEVTQTCASATFYHTPLWSNVLAQTFPRWKPATWGIQFEDGNVAVVPMLRSALVPGLPFHWYESMVPGAYGGPIFFRPPQPAHFAAVWSEIHRLRNVLVMGNPFAEWQMPRLEQRALLTHIVTLGDFEQIFKRFSRGRRTAVRSGKRMGVKITVADFAEHCATYYDIYRDQLKRWGDSAGDFYPLRLFTNLAAYASENPSIRLWTATVDEKMVAGVVVFYYNNQVLLWHAAFLGDYFKYRIADVLYTAVLEDACQAQYTYLDFGQSGGNESIMFFKEAFGAEKRPFSSYRNRTLDGNIYPLRRIVRNKLHLCPLE